MPCFDRLSIIASAECTVLPPLLPFEPPEEAAAAVLFADDESWAGGAGGAAIGCRTLCLDITELSRDLAEALFAAA